MLESNLVWTPSNKLTISSLVNMQWLLQNKPLTLSGKRILFQPGGSISIKYQLLKRVSTAISINQSFYNQQPFNNTNTTILSSFRNITSFNTIPAYTMNNTYNLQFNFKNTVRAIYLSNGFVVQRYTANTFNNISLFNSLTINNRLLTNNVSRSNLLFLNLSKYWYQIKTNIFFNTTMSNNISFQMLNEQAIQTKVKIINYNINISTNLSGVLLDIRYKWESNILSQNNGGKLINTNRLFNCIISKAIGKQWLFQSNVEKQFVHTNTNNNFLFADVSIQKKQIAKKWGINATIQNITNTNTYIQYIIQDNSFSVQRFDLRPRQFLLRITRSI